MKKSDLLELFERGSFNLVLTHLKAIPESKKEAYLLSAQNAKFESARIRGSLSKVEIKEQTEDFYSVLYDLIEKYGAEE